MTEYNIATVVGIAQIILSINLIARRKNTVAIFCEIFSSITLLCTLNVLSPEENNIFWRCLILTFIEYLTVKIFLVAFMAFARLYSFYAIKALCRKKQKKKTNSLKLKFIRTFNKVKYWPRLKLGLPGMADKTHPKTKVRFDSKGFPKFKVYYSVKLRRKYFREARERHFYMANKILYKDAFANAKIRAKFSKTQIKELSQGETPSGYTWHHHQDAGVLQLVEEEIHAKTHHVGGYSIWGDK